MTVNKKVLPLHNLPLPPQKKFRLSTSLRQPVRQRNSMVGDSWDVFTKRVLGEKHISGMMCQNPFFVFLYFTQSGGCSTRRPSHGPFAASCDFVFEMHFST